MVQHLLSRLSQAVAYPGRGVYTRMNSKPRLIFSRINGPNDYCYGGTAWPRFSKVPLSFRDQKANNYDLPFSLKKADLTADFLQHSTNYVFKPPGFEDIGRDTVQEIPEF